MSKKQTILMLLIFLGALLQTCTSQKNKCATCPTFSTNKK